MSRERIERALRRATDTKACVIGEDGTTGILGNGSVVVCYTG